MILMLMSAVVNGEMGSAIQGAILLEDRSYSGEDGQLRRKQVQPEVADLVVNPDQIAAQLRRCLR